MVRRGWSLLLGKLSVVERLLGNASCEDEGAKSSKPPASKLDIFTFFAARTLALAAQDSCARRLRFLPQLGVARGAKMLKSRTQSTSPRAWGARGVLNLRAKPIKIALASVI